MLEEHSQQGGVTPALNGENSLTTSEENRTEGRCVKDARSSTGLWFRRPKMAETTWAQLQTEIAKNPLGYA